MKNGDPKKKKSSKISIKTNMDVGRVGATTLKADRKSAAGTGNSYFSGAVAPRVGGTVPKTGMATGGTKTSVKKALKNVKKSAASPAAKRAARRAYGH